MSPPNAARAAPAIAGGDPCKSVEAGRLNIPEYKDTTAEKQGALRQAVLAELRLIRARLALAVVSLDAIGIATRRRLISSQQAIELSNPLIAEFADRSFDPDPYTEMFCALVEEKRAEYEARQKHRQKWMRAA